MRDGFKEGRQKEMKTDEQGESGRESKTGDRRGLLIMKEKIKLVCEQIKKFMNLLLTFCLDPQTIYDLLQHACSVMSDSSQPHALYPARLLCPCSSLGKNTRMGSHSLLQGIFPAQGSNLSLLHCRRAPYHLSHQRRTVSFLLSVCLMLSLTLGFQSVRSTSSRDNIQVE